VAQLQQVSHHDNWIHPLVWVTLTSQGEAKLDMLRTMKEFKRGIHQLEWENKKCEMEVSTASAVFSCLPSLQCTVLKVVCTCSQLFGVDRWQGCDAICKASPTPQSAQ